MNHNRLAALPAGLHRLEQLERLDAAHNVLETVPASLFRCGCLQLVNLQSNRLKTLPAEVHALASLCSGGLQVKGNPGLVMPKRPEVAAAPGGEHYFLEFAAKGVLGEAHAGGGKGISRQRLGSSRAPHTKPPTSVKTPTARRDSSRGGDLILKGLAGAGATSPGSLLREDDEAGKAAAARFQATMAEADEAMRKPARLIDSMHGPDVDCSGIFGDLTELGEGYVIWRLENFVRGRLENTVAVE